MHCVVQQAVVVVANDDDVDMNVLYGQLDVEHLKRHLNTLADSHCTHSLQTKVLV